MLWRTTDQAGHDEYLAVLRLTRVRVGQELYGQRHYRLQLADGTTVDATFEADEWRQWEAAVGKGGLVINGRARS